MAYLELSFFLQNIQNTADWAEFRSKIIIILFLTSFFTPEFADCLSQESEWQQISTGLQASSLYSNRSQQCCSLDGLDLSSDLQEGTALVFTPLMRFPRQSLVSRSFLVLLRYFFGFFFYLRLFDDVRFQYSLLLVIFLFSKIVFIIDFLEYLKPYKYLQKIDLVLSNRRVNMP